MNQPYARVNQPYATLTLASALREMFGVQLYKNNARELLSRILSILNLDWLQHARSVRGVYELYLSIRTLIMATGNSVPYRYVDKSLPNVYYVASMSRKSKMAGVCAIRWILTNSSEFTIFNSTALFHHS